MCHCHLGKQSKVYGVQICGLSSMHIIAMEEMSFINLNLSNTSINNARQIYWMVLPRKPLCRKRQTSSIAQRHWGLGKVSRRRRLTRKGESCSNVDVLRWSREQRNCCVLNRRRSYNKGLLSRVDIAQSSEYSQLAFYQFLSAPSSRHALYSEHGTCKMVL